jgi:hypothetical protein
MVACSDLRYFAIDMWGTTTPKPMLPAAKYSRSFQGMSKPPNTIRQQGPGNHLFRNLATTIPALLGLLFCLLNAFGSELLCATSGCDIYAGYQFAGISFYVWGGAGFACLLLLGLLSERGVAYRNLLFFCLAAGLFLDSGFLVWQVLFWPCTSCLAVALLLALFAAGLLWSKPSFRSKSMTLVLLLWAVAFIPAAASAGKELFLSPWVLEGPENAVISVIFSPTCPACRTTVEEIYADRALRKQTAFIPISKNDEDLNRLAWFTKDKKPANLIQLFNPGDYPPAKAGFLLRWQLARNKMLLAATGATSVPLVRSPELIFAASKAPFSSSNTSTYESIIFKTPALESGCSAVSNDPDCETTPAPAAE